MFKTFWDLTRFDHAILVAIGIIVGEALVLGGLPPNHALIFSVAAGVFISMGAFALNDYLDFKADKKNYRTDRPLVRGELSPNTAFYFSLICIPLGVLCSALVDSNYIVVWTAALFALLSITYDYYLKKIALVGNLAIAASMAIPFIFGNLVVSGELSTPVIVLAAIAFFLGLGREIIKSIQDMEGDKAAGRRTLPIIAGERDSMHLASFFILVAIVLSFMPFMWLDKYADNLVYLFPIMLADLLLIFVITDAILVLKIKSGLGGQKKLKAMRALTLLAMMLGLAGFLLGAFYHFVL